MKSIVTGLVFLLSLNGFGQDIDFNKSSLKMNYSIEKDVFKFENAFENGHAFDFSKQYDVNFFDNEAQKNLKSLSLQIEKESMLNSINRNDSELFLNHCGPLKDGLYSPIKGEDAILSNLFDNLINKYLLPKSIFQREK